MFFIGVEIVNRWNSVFSPEEPLNSMWIVWSFIENKWLKLHGSDFIGFKHASNKETKVSNDTFIWGVIVQFTRNLHQFGKFNLYLNGSNVFEEKQ